MVLRNKVIGILLIALGILPFLLKLESVGSFFDKYTFLAWFTPGEIIYQLIIVILGILLLFQLRTRVATRPY